MPSIDVLIAPDAFKGSLDSVAVAQAMSDGLRAAWPEVKVDLCPMTDGGEGAINALGFSDSGGYQTVTVSGPYGSPVKAHYWLGDDGVAIIEMAQASGISLSAERDPMRASSFGTGELILAAAKSPAREIWVACGGSATVDGGMGMLQGLGWRCLDVHGKSIPRGASGFALLETIEPGPYEIQQPIKVLHDVKNRLLGPSGCVPVYGPQKGVSPDQFELYENGLRRLALRLDEFGNGPVERLEGGGAAGGLGAALVGALGGQLCGGFETLSARLGLEQRLSRSSLVLTGEGRLDAQTPFGKTISGIWNLAKTHQVPVWAFAGSVTPEAEAWCPEGMAMIPTMSGPCDLSDAMTNAMTLLSRAVQRAAVLATTGAVALSRSS